MSASYFSLMDMAIAGVPIILFGVWQLISINREIAKDKARKADPGSPESARHPIGEHRLDDR